MSSTVTYGRPQPLNANVTFEGSCTVDGYSTWGFRLTCAGCGEVEASTVGSSVAYEDHPPRFASRHATCGRCPVCSTAHRNPARTVHDFCPVAQAAVDAEEAGRA